MSIRDIIEAATPGPWRLATSKSVKVGDMTICRTHDRKWRYGNDERETADARFIATFYPEHVALMEAAGEAAADYLQDACNECGFRTCEMPDSDIGCSLDDIRNTLATLVAHRKERGL